MSDGIQETQYKLNFYILSKLVYISSIPVLTEISLFAYQQ